MKITKRHLKMLIKESRNTDPMTPEYVLSSLDGQAQGPGRGSTFGQLALAALQSGDFVKAANKLMDAMWIDDPPPGAEEELAHTLEIEARTLEDLAAIGAEWGTHHFRGGR